MRRQASLVAAVLVLYAPSVRAEPLDLDLARLGAPDPAIWTTLAEVQGLPPLDPAVAAALASEAKVRFATISTELALALSSSILQPASTTGHSGFAFDMEGSYVQVHPQRIGTTAFPSSPAVEAGDPWPSRGMDPHELFVPSFHVRKALPFSFELGGRMIYLSQSSYFAAQIEGKWALNEGFDVLPDLAVRVAHTKLYGQRDWDLASTDLDFMVSKRWGVNGVTSFTPYLAERFTFVDASTEVVDFGPARGTTTIDAAATQARFPSHRAAYHRTTAGLRMTAYAMSLAGEVTYFGGWSHDGKSAPLAGEYPDYKLASTLGGAVKVGFEF